MKTKTHFTRKNLIFLALLFLFLVFQVFSMTCLNVGSGMKEDNPIALFAKMLNISLFKLDVFDYVTFFLVIFYTFICVAAVLYEYRIAKFYNENPFGGKKFIQYGITVFVSLVLSFGLAILLQLPYSLDKFIFQISLLLQTFTIALIIYLIIASLILAVCVLIINVKHIDQPFKFFGKADAAMQEEIDAQAEKNAKDLIKNSDISNSLDIPQDEDQTRVVGSNGVVGGSNPTSLVQDTELKEKEKIFPGLCSIDKEYEFGATPVDSYDVNLSEFCDAFRNYLALNDLYFDIKTIRQFISAFSTTRLVILEGLSGTGKSSLPRYLASFLSTDSFFAPVQSTWRDRTNLIGYYNDFSGSFKETDFLKRLYRANYEKSKINIMVLDELNLSRIEYYFADFLSVLEYPSDLWYLDIMQLPYSFDAPHQLVDGKLRIPENTYFVGTANKDDSTYTITDKVYDRAITIDFEELNEPFEVKEEQLPISLSSEKLNELYLEARSNKSNLLTKKDLAKFKIITDFTFEAFDLTFGNRILNQIQQFVPVYVACGGSKEEALDFLFTRKILYKVEGRFEDYIKNGLLDLKDLVAKEYGDQFSLTINEIDRLLKRL